MPLVKDMTEAQVLREAAKIVDGKNFAISNDLNAKARKAEGNTNRVWVNVTDECTITPTVVDNGPDGEDYRFRGLDVAHKGTVVASLGKAGWTATAGTKYRVKASGHLFKVQYMKKDFGAA